MLETSDLSSCRWAAVAIAAVAAVAVALVAELGPEDGSSCISQKPSVLSFFPLHQTTFLRFVFLVCPVPGLFL